MSDPGGIVFMYIGNLEAYQGIDLLLQAFALHHCIRPADRLVIVGGIPADVARYREKVGDLGLTAWVELRGHQPVDRMGEFFAEADVLVSPRIKGTNTPMKIYSYLDAEKPVLATDLFTHTQVLTPEVSVLVKPEPTAMAAGMRRLADSAELRAQLARLGKQLMSERYSLDAFKRSLDEMYTYVESAVKSGATKSQKR
ncbi:MAG TPA: glycosyltransferase family 4 protein [Kiritimatiellia bacterium]|nr:glycosyltransferase family 4 protein [Kiritimatiellia bacterium]HMP33702.1 glycosyltransferase family 4 protein [Kiritimatiellia bacterium]